MTTNNTATETATYAIECRHASGSSHWTTEPECRGLTADEADSVIGTLETTDEDGGALEYRIVAE